MAICLIKNILLNKKKKLYSNVEFTKIQSLTGGFPTCLNQSIGFNRAAYQFGDMIQSIIGHNRYDLIWPDRFHHTVQRIILIFRNCTLPVCDPGQVIVQVILKSSEKGSKYPMHTNENIAVGLFKEQMIKIIFEKDGAKRG